MLYLPKSIPITTDPALNATANMPHKTAKKTQFDLCVTKTLSKVAVLKLLKNKVDGHVRNHLQNVLFNSVLPF
jgi:hypothetical protein